MGVPYELREGTVRSVSRVNGRVAIVELRGMPGVIQLCTGHTWVLGPGDSVTFLGWQDAKSGKFFSQCYRNMTRRVQDHRSPKHTGLAYAIESAVAIGLFWFGAQFDLSVAWFGVGIVLLHMLLGLNEMIEDVRYSRALKRHAATLAVS